MSRGTGFRRLRFEMRGAPVARSLAMPFAVSVATLSLATALSVSSCAGTEDRQSATVSEPAAEKTPSTPEAAAPPKPVPPPASGSAAPAAAQGPGEAGAKAAPPSPGAAAVKAADALKTPAEQKIEASMALRKERRYDEAIALLREALALSPPPDTAIDIYLKIGEAHFRKAQDAQYGRIQGEVAIEKELIEATRILDEGLAKHPDLAKSPDAAFLRGSAFLLTGRLEDAKTAYLGLMRRYPAYAYNHQALLRVGICEASMGDAAAAGTTFERLIAAYPDKEVEVKKARRYTDELRVFGQRAKPISADTWIRGMAKDGLSTFDGEVRVLIFFATWCENCKDEIPHLRSIIQELSAKGVVFLGVANPEDPKNTVAVDVYLEREKIPFLDVALDRTFASWNSYRVISLPAGVVIDRKGIVRWRGHPAFFPKRLVEGLLAEEAKPSS